MNALLLPGTLCDAALWAGVDLPEGVSAVDTVRGSTLKEAAELTVSTAPPQFHLIGFSLGAIVAFEVLRRFPKRVTRLTLISANPHAPNAAQLEAWDGQRQQVEAGDFDDVARTLSASAGTYQPEVLAMARRVGADIFLQQLKLLRSRPESRPMLAHYAGPLTLLVGENDTVTPLHLAEEMRLLALQTNLQIIPNAGHYLPLDAPEAVSNVLKEVAHV